MEELIQKIEKWMEDQNLVRSSTPLNESMKLFIKFGELSSSVIQNDLDSIKCSIGNLFIILAVMCKQNHKNIYDYLEFKYIWPSDVKTNVLEIAYRLGDFSEEASKYNFEDQPCLRNLLSIMRHIAKIYNISLEECITSCL